MGFLSQAAVALTTSLHVQIPCGDDFRGLTRGCTDYRGSYTISTSTSSPADIILDKIRLKTPEIEDLLEPYKNSDGSLHLNADQLNNLISEAITILNFSEDELKQAFFQTIFNDVDNNLRRDLPNYDGLTDAERCVLEGTTDAVIGIIQGSFNFHSKKDPATLEANSAAQIEHRENLTKVDGTCYSNHWHRERRLVLTTESVLGIIESVLVRENARLGQALKLQAINPLKFK